MHIYVHTHNEIYGLDSKASARGHRKILGVGSSLSGARGDTDE